MPRCSSTLGLHSGSAKKIALVAKGSPAARERARGHRVVRLDAGHTGRHSWQPCSPWPACTLPPNHQAPHARTRAPHDVASPLARPPHKGQHPREAGLRQLAQGRVTHLQQPALGRAVEDQQGVTVRGGLSHARVSHAEPGAAAATCRARLVDSTRATALQTPTASTNKRTARTAAQSPAASCPPRRCASARTASR